MTNLSYISELKEKLGLGNGLHLLRENVYCRIYQGSLHTDATNKVIVKAYRSDAEGLRLAKGEYQGLEDYNCQVGKLSGMVSCAPLGLVQEGEVNAFAFSYFSGYSLSQLFYKAFWSVKARNRLFAIVNRLCLYLCHNFRQGNNVNELSGFFAEYLRYCSGRLENHLIGGWLCPGFMEEACRLCQEMSAIKDKITVCRTHGDFVPANILINDKDEICLIDFANTQADGHVLSDIYGFLCSIQYLAFYPLIYRPIAEIFRGLITESSRFLVERRFFYEFHRRRWMWLKLSSFNPLRQLGALPLLWSPFDDG